MKILSVGWTNISDISFLEKNKNIKELNIDACNNIKDFTSISKLERLEFLSFANTDISDISFLEKNKNIKKLSLRGCNKINKKSNIFNRKDISIIE